MGRTLEAHDKLIREIFEGSYQFVIPEYQRPYAWTTEQAGELVDDLILAMREASGDPSESQYFLGSIVLIKNDREPKASVVDGQQRLTTLTMFFSALRVLMPEAAEDITDFLYKKGKASFGENNQYRLTARQEDAEFFRRWIQVPGGIEQLVVNTERLDDSRMRYRENAILLLEKMRLLSSAERERLWQFLANDCSLVVISTPNLEAAYRIFSVLNNRGLDLAPIDILKAEILDSIRRAKGDEAGTAYVGKWSNLETGLGRDAFGELFGHIRTLYAKQKQRATLVKEFQEHVAKHVKPDDLIDRIIAPYAEAWGFIREADFEAAEHAETINEYLSWLNRVDFKDWVPPALVYFKRFRNKTELLANFFQALERLTYFLLITKVGVNARIEIYAALTREIEAELFEGSVDALVSLALSEAQKRDFIAELDGDIYKKLPRARMALMLRLEALVSDGSKKQSFDNLSLEHVLPQNPRNGSEWRIWFAEDEERELWTHRIANLVPLHIRKNPAAGNYKFEKKKDVYFNAKGKASPFILTNEVREIAIWNPEVLAQRQTRLLNILKRHWALDPAA